MMDIGKISRLDVIDEAIVNLCKKRADIQRQIDLLIRERDQITEDNG